MTSTPERQRMTVQERLRDICGCNIDTSPCGSEYECRLNQEAADLLDEMAEALRATKPFLQTGNPAFTALEERDVREKVETALSNLKGGEQ